MFPLAWLVLLSAIFPRHDMPCLVVYLKFGFLLGLTMVCLNLKDLTKIIFLQEFEK